MLKASLEAKTRRNTLVCPALQSSTIGQIYLKASCQGNVGNVVACNADGRRSHMQTPELQALAVLTLQAWEGHSQAGHVQSLLGFMAGM